MSRRDVIKKARRVVIKIGSALLTNDGRGLDKPAIAAWVAQMATLREQGLDVVLVSSGSVAEGMKRLGWQRRPQSLHELQAAAAVGQMGLVQNYETEFQRYGFHTAQILLVHEDLIDRRRYLNARNTLTTLLKLGVVPVVNENDTIATDEIRFGDNDTLAAMVANIVDADLLVIMTDQPAMYDADPRSNAAARPIDEIRADDPALIQMAGGSSALGRGGMITKVRAAQLASRSGTDTVVVGGRIPDVLDGLFAGEKLGTLLYGDTAPLEARKLWLAGLSKSRGSLVLDDGAVAALKRGGVSLLAVGVTSLSGCFAVGDLVVCHDLAGKEVAKGLINYDFADAEKIIGLSSHSFMQKLGYQADPELIHCDNLVVTG